MELFDRDDIKKALIYLLPVFIVLIIIVITTRAPRSSKNDESSGSVYHYGKDEKPFTVYIDSNRVDLVWDDKTISQACRSLYSHNRSIGVLISTPDEISEGLLTRTFSANSPQIYGSKFRLSQGFALSDGEEAISRGLSDSCVRNSDSSECSYYWAFYLDDEEIDYSKLDFSVADEEGAYMKNMLMGRVCELYCRDQLIDGKAHICTSIMITTAEKNCDSCTIQIITPEGFAAEQ